MIVRRYDTSHFGPLERTPQGGYVIPAYPTRVGVFSYTLPDGTERKEYRPADEVFAPASLLSLRYAPVTDLHPERGGVRIPVTPENYQEFCVGHVLEDVRQEGNLVAATVAVQAATVIEKINAGTYRELSCGYHCQYDESPGTSPEGEKYDAVQREIRYNHLAVGPRDWGRAGPSVALKLDASDAIQTVNTVEKEIIDGKEYVVGSAEWRSAVNTRTVKLAAERDQALGRADAAEKAAVKLREASKSSADQAKEVTRRVKLLVQCQRLADELHVRFDATAAAGVEEGDLIVEAIKMLDPSFTAEGKSPDYLAGYFSALMKATKPVSAATSETSETSTTSETQDTIEEDPNAKEQKTDGKTKVSVFDARNGTRAENKVNDKDRPDPDKERQKMLERSTNAWKGKQT